MQVLKGLTERGYQLYKAAMASSEDLHPLLSRGLCSAERVQHEAHLSLVRFCDQALRQAEGAITLYLVNNYALIKFLPVFVFYCTCVALKIF